MRLYDAYAHVDEPFGLDSSRRDVWISTVIKLMEKRCFSTSLLHWLTHTCCPLAHDVHRLNYSGFLFNMTAVMLRGRVKCLLQLAILMVTNFRNFFCQILNRKCYLILGQILS